MPDFTEMISNGVGSIGTAMVNFSQRIFGGYWFWILVVIGLIFSACAVGMGAFTLKPVNPARAMGGTAMTLGVLMGLSVIGFMISGISGADRVDARGLTFTLGGAFIAFIFASIGVGLFNASDPLVPSSACTAIATGQQAVETATFMQYMRNYFNKPGATAATTPAAPATTTTTPSATPEVTVPAADSTTTPSTTSSFGFWKKKR